MIDTLRRKRLHLAVMIAAAIFLRSAGPCLPASFREQTGADAAEAKYAASGAGVAIAIMDRGIDWDHPDFINPDGTTRIKWLYDMSPVIPVEYSEAQINAALHGGPTINERD